MKLIKKYLYPLIILIVFEAVAVTLWLTKDNLFYLFNFSYIGLSISLPMDVDVTDNSRKRKNGTECILCMECVKNCPKKAL